MKNRQDISLPRFALGLALLYVITNVIAFILALIVYSFADRTVVPKLAYVFPGIAAAAWAIQETN